jgi:hypothetical protein
MRDMNDILQIELFGVRGKIVGKGIVAPLMARVFRQHHKYGQAAPLRVDRNDRDVDPVAA